jgi:hypothetical protein
VKLLALSQKMKPPFSKASGVFLLKTITMVRKGFLTKFLNVGLTFKRITKNLYQKLFVSTSSSPFLFGLKV